MSWESGRGPSHGVGSGQQAGCGEAGGDGAVGGDCVGSEIDAVGFQGDRDEGSGGEVVSGGGLLLAELQDG